MIAAGAQDTRRALDPLCNAGGLPSPRRHAAGGRLNLRCLRRTRSNNIGRRAGSSRSGSCPRPRPRSFGGGSRRSSGGRADRSRATCAINRTCCLAWLAELVRCRSILDAVEDLHGPDLLCWNNNFFIKEAADPAFVSWHQASTYWGLSKPDVVTAWVPSQKRPRRTGQWSTSPKATSSIRSPSRHLRQ